MRNDLIDLEGITDVENNKTKDKVQYCLKNNFGQVKWNEMG